MFNTVHFNRLEFSHYVTHNRDNERFVPHHHIDYEILYIMRGSGSFLIEDTSYAFSDGTVFLIPPGIFHVLETPPQNDYERVCIYFPPELLPPCVSPPDRMCKAAGDDLMPLFLKFDRYADVYPKDVLYTLFVSFLSELIVTLTYSSRNDLTAQECIPPLVKNAVAFIAAHIEKPLALSDIASGVFVSPTHLSHAFSQTMHISVMQYVRLKKMFLARSLLQSGYAPTKVAALVGYADYPTFYKNYVAVMHLSPSREYVK